MVRYSLLQLYKCIHCCVCSLLHGEENHHTDVRIVIKLVLYILFTKF